MSVKVIKILYLAILLVQIHISLTFVNCFLRVNKGNYSD